MFKLLQTPRILLCTEAIVSFSSILIITPFRVILPSGNSAAGLGGGVPAHTAGVEPFKISYANVPEGTESETYSMLAEFWLGT
jgi:hypothetical protein